MRHKTLFLALFGGAIVMPASGALADPLNCSFADYRTEPGLIAEVAGDVLTVIWDGARPQEATRLRFVLKNGQPRIRELAVRAAGGDWTPLAADIAPEFRVTTGLRRVTEQQLRPLRALGKEITSEVIDNEKWEAFWDAPLKVDAPDKFTPRDTTFPLAAGLLHQPGLPRSPGEIARSSAAYKVTGCEVRTNGARLEISFPGVELGVFSGRLQYSVYRGTNLIRQEIVAKTDEPSVAYKYDAGLTGLAITPDARMVWQDISSAEQTYAFGGTANERAVPIQSKNRLIAAETKAGTIAVMPPPHNFFWARELTTNLGVSWYRKDSPTRFSFGVRQAESEIHPAHGGRGRDDFRDNFALVSARPGTWQRMAVYIVAEARPAADTLAAARAFTRDDRYKALPGHKVMLAHVHAYFIRRLGELGHTVDNRPMDFDAARAAGVNIFSPIDGGAAAEDGEPTTEEYLTNLSTIYEIAKRHSDKDFVVMPNLEVTEGEVPNLVKALGGHWDIHVPRPVLYAEGRTADQPLIDTHPKFGPFYRLGSADDVMEMMNREGMIAFMPHPRSKGSTGYPDAIRDTPRFRSEAFRGIGYRWGMGLDGSEPRLCDKRCLTTLDDMNNWVADLPTPPKYLQAISEAYQQGPGDDIYGHTPVNYLKLDRLPEPGDWRPIVEALRKGEYFVTSGEVLIPSHAILGKGRKRTYVADVEWTYPLEFVELVWGDGKRTGRQVIPATHLPAFGSKRFEIPFDTRGKKWIRFAVWDSAGNGALTQPVKLPSAAQQKAGR